MILQTQNNLEKQTAICLQIEKDLKTSKDQISYLNSFRSDVQTRFFDLLDKNVMLKEAIEKVKQENIMLNIELSQYKLLGIELKTESIQEIKNDFHKMKLQLESAKNEILKLELKSRGKGKIKEVPKWILDAKTKGTEGL